VQRPLISEPRGWLTGQTPWPIDPTLQPLMGLLHRHALQEVVTRIPKLEVGASRTQWPAGQHLACYRLNQVSNSFLDPYKYPHTDGIQDITLYL
jgi:hypothetical protein